MGNTVYNWDQAINPITDAITQYLSRQNFNSQLDQMFGQQNLAGAPGMQASAQMPGMQMPQAAPANVPGNQVTARMPGGYHPTIGGGALGGRNIDVSTPALAPQTNYAGPIGQTLG